MRSPLPTLTACGCLALALGLPTGASAKPKRLDQATYTVIARATMEEHWRFLERSQIKCDPGSSWGTCTTERSGSGSASIQLKSKPTTWLVTRGFGGRPPQLNVGTGEGAPMTGSYLRSGKLPSSSRSAAARPGTAPRRRRRAPTPCAPARRP